jgi:hypothetical protein
LTDELDGALHLDYRQRRGVGLGPDANFHLGRWGEGTLRYYYLHDDDPNASVSSLTNALPTNRQRVSLGYQATPFTDLSVRSMVRWQSDIAVSHDYFESDYRQNPQPSTFVEADKLWQNFSLDLYVQPRVNDFLETVERLPDLRLTGFRQQVFQTPIYYESESSAGYYERRFAESNALFAAVGPFGTNDYSAARADTYHQLLLPETFFGWLNVTPRVGGRFTYYSHATGPGATTDDIYRGVFNTGAEVSFKASRVWNGARSELFDVDGLRHIIEPSLNYVFVPTPNRAPPQLPQFDSELPSLRLLPLDFPDYNSIDSIDSQNVLRLGLRNKLQTKRNNDVENLLNCEVFTDWRIKPRPDQGTFADIYSDIDFKPRSWITLSSETRFGMDDRRWREANHTLTLSPDTRWSWVVGHRYLRSDPTLGRDSGNNTILSSLYYRFNENWAARLQHRFEARDGQLEEQYYTVYRDFRSWTAGLTFRVRESRIGPTDYGVALTVSLKALPRFKLGDDQNKPTLLLGG